MNKLHIKPQKDSPEVIFDTETNVFSVKGICHPENVLKFFQPVIEWLDKYKSYLKDTNTKIDIQAIFFFRYFNSATYKYLVILFQKLHEFTEQGSTLHVEWHYEIDDEEMKESGEELFEFSKLNIRHTFIETAYK